MPPGGPIYPVLNLPMTDYALLGMPATTLIIAILNGVIFGIIAWATYAILDKRGILK